MKDVELEHQLSLSHGCEVRPGELTWFSGEELMGDATGRRAAAFRKTREAHATEVAEDYVELIGDLIVEFGEARLTDLADSMAVTGATVSKIVSRLKREGLVENRPYRSIFLTDAGREMADAARRRHRVVLDFLLALGVDEATAEADSEGVEHHVSDITLRALAKLTRELRAERRRSVKG